MVTSKLSPREMQILGLVADGKSNKEVASMLNIAEKTVRNNFTMILDKLGMHSRLEAAIFYVRSVEPSRCLSCVVEERGGTHCAFISPEVTRD